MKKRIIFLPILALIISFGVLSMFACEKKGNSADTFASYQEMITTFTAGDNFFEVNNVEGYVSNYYLKNFDYKNSSGTKIDEDQNYQFLNTIGLNFIEKYYEKIDGLDKLNFSSLNKSIKSLTNSYEKIKVEWQNLVNIDSSADYEIYNGYSTRYKWEVKEFINEVYDGALTLANFLVDKVGYLEGIGEETTDEKEEENLAITPQEQLEFYLDYQNLLLANDFKIFYLDSCCGQKLDDQLSQNTTLNFKKFVQTINSTQKTLTNEDIKNLINVNDAFNLERQTTLKALDKLNFYEFVTSYESNIISYEKENKYCEAYYRQIEKYFSESNCLIDLYINYITTNIYVA